MHVNCNTQLYLHVAISPLIVAVLQTPDCKGILVTANYGQMQSPCMEYNT